MKPAPSSPPVIAMSAESARDLASGLVQLVELRVEDHGAVVGRCAITYDLWNESYEVERDGKRRDVRGRQAALAACLDDDALVRARTDAIASGQRFAVVAVIAIRRERTWVRSRDRIWCGGGDDRLLNVPYRELAGVP